MAAGADTASAFPALQAGAHLSMPSSENSACDECCPRFMFRSTGGCSCCWTSHAF